MYVDSLTFKDFRNLGGRVQLAWPVAVLVGANNTGKSNIVDALRMVLTPQAGYRERLGLERDDFRHDGDGVTQATDLEIEVSFGGLSARQRGRMLTMLDVGAGPDRAVLRLRSTLPERGRPRSVILGGRSRTPEVEDWAREAVTFTYLPALRDAEEDLSPGRGPNRLVALLSAFAPTAVEQREIVELAEKANEAMRGVDIIARARESVQERLDRIVGSGYAQGVDMLLEALLTRFDAFTAVEDKRVPAYMRALAQRGVVSGTTGVAGLVGLAEIRGCVSGARSALVINTEGAADAEGYATTLLS